MKKFHTQTAVNAAFAGRDRALLYTRGMDIDPVKSVSIVMESLSRSGNDAPPSAVMGELFHILQAGCTDTIIHDKIGEPLTSAPPINRTHVLAKDVEPLSLTGALAVFFRKQLKKLTEKYKGNA